MNENTQADNPPGRIVAAMERGPGPGRYSLPSTVGYIDHDITKHKKPAYPFGERLLDPAAKYMLHASPGPMYNVHPKMTRHGRDGFPEYSMLGPHQYINMDNFPAPGRYYNELVHPQREAKAPSYSIKYRTRRRLIDTNPAANRYGLPSTLGSGQQTMRSNPSYSMTPQRDIGSFYEDLAKTPGPGQHNAVPQNKYQNRLPEYSMQGRNFMPGDSTRKPGPGAHRPEQVIVHKPFAPKFSLGVRHSEFVVPLIP